ncbi:MAG: hypothetical protein PHF86_12335 [Candidatus Nanoarchaeia archaeon]|nr:hypothetical protein [Candidatus Nanoarchaeia archaeon]
MKKRVGISIVVSIIIIMLIFFIGKGITGNVVKNTCDSPYIYVGGNCCLDKDNNKICDSDEKPTSMIRAIDAKESCSVDRKLTCTWKRISDNKVSIKFRNDQSGIFSVTSIELSNVGKNGCKQVFSGKVEDGFDYQREKQYDLECSFTEDYIDSLIIVKGITYERSKGNGPSIMPYTTWTFESDGHISGFKEV